MSKRKTAKRHKPPVKPRVNHRPAYSMIAEERMNRIMHRMQEVLAGTHPLELVRDVAAQMCEETCKLRVFPCDQADEE